MNERILFVDDEPNVLSAIQRQLRGRYEVRTAVGPEEGIAALEGDETFAIVVSDMRMPGMNGVEYLTHVRRHDPDIVRMVLTGQSELSTTIAAVNQGNVFRFLTKPCSTEELTAALDAGLEHYRLVMAERVLLEDTLRGAVSLLMDVLATVDPATFSRSGRVQRLIAQLATFLGVPFTWDLKLAGKLSLIGCLSVPREVLAKALAGRDLDEEESKLFAAHPENARQLLARIPRLEPVAELVGDQASPPNPSSLPSSVEEWSPHELGVQILYAAVRFDELLAHGETKPRAFETIRDEGKLHRHTIAALARLQVDELVQVKKVNVADLRPGMVLDDDITSTQGGLLLAKEYEITEAIVLRLKSQAERGIVNQPLRVRVSVSVTDGEDGRGADAEGAMQEAGAA